MVERRPWTMKLRVAEGCHAVSCEGKMLEIIDDGSVEVDDAAVETLVAHGLTAWKPEAVLADIATMTRDELITRIIDKTLTMRFIIKAS
jgi:hypothetical protein